MTTVPSIEKEPKKKYPRADAIAVAKELVAVLAPCCLPERLYVAGSLRRRKPEVGDVELVFVPQTFAGTPVDFFSPAPEIARTDEIFEGLLKHGILAKRPNVNGGFAWGPKNKLAVHVQSGIPVDLFSATSANFWNYLVCRTGGAETNDPSSASAGKEGGDV